MTTYSAADLASKPKVMGEWGDVVAVSGKVTPAALASSDIIRPLIIPAGLECFAVIVANDDLDSNGSPTVVYRLGFTPVSANDGALTAVDNYFAPAGQTDLQALNNGKVYANFDPKKFEQDVFLDLLANTGSATYQSGSVRVTALCRAVGAK